jgi:NTP pyrophosphatase (non-canonical NTP hydrolase)
MAATLREMAETQMDFDSKHGRDGVPWSQNINSSNLPVLLECTVALAGEVGEFANVVKKIVRGDFSLELAKPDIRSELADILIYLLKLSNQLDIDLEKAFALKVAQNEKRFASYLLSPNE